MSPLLLILHIEASVKFNLTSGRIDVQKLLSSELIRFWAVVSSDPRKEPIRRVLQYSDRIPLSVVLTDLGVPYGQGLAEWSWSICPTPRKSSPESVPNTTWSVDDRAPKRLGIGIVCR